MSPIKWYSTWWKAGAVFLCSLIVLAILMKPYMGFPPIWDAAAGIFAPAIYLVESGFDFTALLNEGGYRDAESNVHTFSIMTFVTYLMIVLGQGDPAQYLPWLHTIQILLSACIISLTFVIARAMMGDNTALLIALILAVSPMYLVQTSYVYTEIPGALSVLLSLLCWAYRKYWFAILAALFAISIKSFGITLCMSLVFLSVIELRKGNIQQILVPLLVLIASVVGFELFKWQGVNATTALSGSYVTYLSSIIKNILRVPDLFLWISLYLFALTLVFLKKKLYFPRIAYQYLKHLCEGGVRSRLWLGSFIFCGCFLGFIATIYLSGRNLFPLSRYYVWILPLLIIVSVASVRHILYRQDNTNNILSKYSHLTISLILISAILFFSIANWKGKFYPKSYSGISSFSIVERSFEYLDFYHVQRSSVRYLAEKHSHETIFVTRGEYYFLSSPMMGYVDTVPDEVRYLLSDDYRAADLKNYPEKFLLLSANSNEIHGQGVVWNILKKVETDSHYNVRILKTFQQGSYRAFVYEIERV